VLCRSACVVSNSCSFSVSPEHTTVSSGQESRWPRRLIVTGGMHNILPEDGVDFDGDAPIIAENVSTLEPTTCLPGARRTLCTTHYQNPFSMLSRGRSDAMAAVLHRHGGELGGWRGCGLRLVGQGAVDEHGQALPPRVLSPRPQSPRDWRAQRTQYAPLARVKSPKCAHGPT